MKNLGTVEYTFESVIEFYFLENGYKGIDKTCYDKEKAIFPQSIIDFIQSTQTKEWKRLEALLGNNVEQQVLHDLCKWMDTYGSLTTLRHGFKCYGRTLYVALFKASHTMNPELDENYSKNILGITRQLQYSTRNNNSLDVILSINGIPVVTLELKNPMTNQNIDNAKKQYRNDRDPRLILNRFA
jgi:type I restriction enzyme R subunit